MLLTVTGCGGSTDGGSTGTAPVAPVTIGASTTVEASDTTTTAAPGPSTTSAVAPTTTEGLPSETTTETIVLAEPVTQEDLFARIAEAVEPLPIFAPTRLPDGATLLRHWLPVIESEDPTHSTPATPNPLIMGTGEDAEVQVVYQVGAGWLVVIENFHGDLGDISGSDAGEVDGIAAALYEVNGGQLVQWGFDGKWYGVFGRGVVKGVILATALGMVQASAESL